MSKTYLHPAHRALIELLAEIVAEELVRDAGREPELDGADGRGETANKTESNDGESYAFEGPDQGR